MASTGDDNSFDADSFREGLRIDIISMDDDEMVRSVFAGTLHGHPLLRHNAVHTELPLPAFHGHCGRWNLKDSVGGDRSAVSRGKPSFARPCRTTVCRLRNIARAHKHTWLHAHIARRPGSCPGV